MKEELVYSYKLKEEFEVPTISVDELAREAFDNYIKNKEFKLRFGGNPKAMNLLKGVHASALRKTVISVYRIEVIVKILDNLMCQEKISIKSLNDFSKKYFGTTMNNNDIYKITSSKEYSNLFQKNFNKGARYTVVFELNEEQEQEIISRNAFLIAKANALFKTYKQ